MSRSATHATFLRFRRMTLTAVGLLFAGILLPLPADAANGTFNCSYYLLHGVQTNTFSSYPIQPSHVVNGTQGWNGGQATG
jgi:hypothetical protein